MPREPFERPPRKTERVAIATVAPHACQDACTQTARGFLLPREGKPRACTRARKQERRMTRPTKNRRATRECGCVPTLEPRPRGSRRSRSGDRCLWTASNSAVAVRRELCEHGTDKKRAKGWSPSNPTSSFDDESCLGASEVTCVLSKPRNIRCVFIDASGQAAQHSAKRTRPDETTPAPSRVSSGEG